MCGSASGAETAQALRDDPMLRFELCTGVSGVHYPAEKGAEHRVVTQGLRGLDEPLARFTPSRGLR